MKWWRNDRPRCRERDLHERSTRRRRRNRGASRRRTVGTGYWRYVGRHLGRRWVTTTRWPTQMSIDPAAPGHPTTTPTRCGESRRETGRRRGYGRASRRHSRSDRTSTIHLCGANYLTSNRTVVGRSRRRGNRSRTRGCPHRSNGRRPRVDNARRRSGRGGRGGWTSTRGRRYRGVRNRYKRDSGRC